MLQCGEIHRFCIMSIHTTLDGTTFVLHKSICRKCKDQYTLCIHPVHLANLFRCCPSIHDRHLHIHKDKIIILFRMCSKTVNCFLTILCQIDFWLRHYSVELVF